MCELSGYHIMIVSKYFKTTNDFINLELVCKKFSGNMEKFHFNPIPLNSKTFKYFPNIETLHLWNVKDENFGNGFSINTKENENNAVLKRKFFCVIVWFNVDFETVDRNKSRNIKFQNVTYTQNDREKFGNNIPSSVTSIGNCCFSGCSSLSSIVIPYSVKSISDFCFNQCSNLSSINILSSVTSIGNGCFIECSRLSCVTIPSSVIFIGNSCFFRCSSLSIVDIPSSVTLIGNCCFSGCSSLSSINIPSSVTSIGGSCFFECSNLRDVNIQSSVKSIGDCCFFRCSSLISITIPSSVTSIGNYCFSSNTVVHQSK
ncbi:hypothetical protein EIN_454480 [Entamoeba invadens IP1]|uniref:Leucine rich repeat containing protein BspA family protein n=1 Tax=Entamoeba invadens IP1 TaxID=370355 RepID=L7FMW6_ENTIV|nr:hypothetical protein EIN_454480 [Entamoeba invadens IP1]ELP89708.1 hypothetical protein EIN_454480 [Entamoeba invadens IP1]|eukprot:XP_004256479.1 hypothetical protein EIN_454480 [Entamoeba invadens IP1]